MRSDDQTSEQALADVLPFPSSGRHEVPSESNTSDVMQPLLRDVIGDVLRDERLEQDRTLVDVARQAAVSLPYLSEVERGRKDVSSDVLRAICDALDLPLSDLLHRSARRLVTPPRFVPGPARDSSSGRRTQGNSRVQLRAA